MLALVVAIALSVHLKLNNRFHGMLFFHTPDTEHLYQAAMWHDMKNQVDNMSLIVQDPVARGLTVEMDRNLFPGSPSKYPLFSTHVYYWVLDLLEMKVSFPSGFCQLLPIARTVNIIAFGVFTALILWLPLPFYLRATAILFSCLSMILHQYSGDVRVHSLAGTLCFLSVLPALYVPHTSIPWAMVSVCGLLSGLATGTLFTGGITLLSLLMACLCRLRSGKSTLAQVALMYLLGMLCWALAFSIFFPSIGQFLCGEGPLFFQEHFKDQNFFGLFGWGGLEGYLNDLCGVEPFLGFTYLAGLYFLIRSGQWRESVWIIILSTVATYQISMAVFYDYTVRRASFILPLVLPVAAYGCAALWRLRPRLMAPLIVFGAVFSMANILKYNQLTASDTRDLMHTLIRNNVEGHGVKVIMDDLGPCLESSKDGLIDGLVDGLSLKLFFSQIRQGYFEDPPTRDAINALGGLTAMDKPENLPDFMRLAHIDFYLLDGRWRTYASAFDTRPLIKACKQIAVFHPRPSATDNGADIIWPPDGNSYFIWKMWRLQHAGPRMELYKLVPNQAPSSSEKAPAK